MNFLVNIFQIGKLEDTRNRTLNGILRVQSTFRGHKARLILREMKRRIHNFQSCMPFRFISENSLDHIINGCNLVITFFTVIRGQKDRKKFAVLLHRHRSAAHIQKWIKANNVRKEFKKLYDAADVFQAGNLFVSCSFTCKQFSITLNMISKIESMLLQLC